MVRPPDHIVTDRLTLRRWAPVHAVPMKAAIDASLAHLQAWMPWATAEPTPLPDLGQRLAQFGADFDAGHRWLYGVFPPDETVVLGGVGLHPMTDPKAPADSLEIGYWLRADMTGKGYATEAVRAVSHLPGIALVQIRCDPRNARSAAVARRLGFHHSATLLGNATTPAGRPRDTMIWQLSHQGKQVR